MSEERKRSSCGSLIAKICIACRKKFYIYSQWGYAKYCEDCREAKIAETKQKYDWRRSERGRRCKWCDIPDVYAAFYNSEECHACRKTARLRGRTETGAPRNRRRRARENTVSVDIAAVLEDGIARRRVVRVSRLNRYTSHLGVKRNIFTLVNKSPGEPRMLVEPIAWYRGFIKAPLMTSADPLMRVGPKMIRKLAYLIDNECFVFTKEDLAQGDDIKVSERLRIRHWRALKGVVEALPKEVQNEATVYRFCSEEVMTRIKNMHLMRGAK